MKQRMLHRLTVLAAAAVISVLVPPLLHAEDSIYALRLTADVNRQALESAGPVVLWATDRWAILQTRAVDQAEPLLRLEHDAELFLVSTFSGGTLAELPAGTVTRRMDDNVYVACVPAAMYEPGAGLLDAVRLDQPFAYHAGADTSRIPDQAVYHQIVQDMVDAVSTDDMFADLDVLVDFVSRRSSSSKCFLASEFLVQAYHELGLYVTATHHTPEMAPSIVAELPGSVTPEEIVVICAHYDSINSDPRAMLAPGADDNGSGSVAVLQAAKILSQYRFERTIRFIAFSGEEQGLYGSKSYASAAKNRGDDIVGVYNYDMIGWVDPFPEDLDCIGNEASMPLIDFFTQNAQLYTALPVVPVTDSSATYSDHSPFWNYGYPAMCGIEDHPITYPYYHSAGDTVDKVDPDFLTEVTRGAVAALAELAVISDLPAPTPVPQDDDIGVRFQLNQTMFHEGDTFNILINHWNRSPEERELPFFVILDIGGQYWFRPSWSQALDFETATVLSRTEYQNAPFMKFFWPKTDGAMDGIRIWGAYVEPDFSGIVGVHTVVTWGYE